MAGQVYLPLTVRVRTEGRPGSCKCESSGASQPPLAEPPLACVGDSAVDTADLTGRLRISRDSGEIPVYVAECCYSSADSDCRSAKSVVDVDSHSVDLISEAFSGVLQVA